MMDNALTPAPSPQSRSSCPENSDPARQHHITYTDAYSSWEEALPLGNGHFGAMAYFDRCEGLTFVLNHYDVYYRRLSQYCRAATIDEPIPDLPRYDIEVLKQRGLEARQDPTSPAHKNYNCAFRTEVAESYGVTRGGPNRWAQIVPACIRLDLAEPFRDAEGSRLRLAIEQAALEFQARNHQGHSSETVQLRTMISPNRDLLLMQFSQSAARVVRAVELAIPRADVLDIEVEAQRLDPQTVMLRGRFHAHGDDPQKDDPFRFVAAVRVVGTATKPRYDQKRGCFTVELDSPGAEWSLLATVIAEEDGADGAAQACRLFDEAEKNTKTLLRSHQEHWQRFWSRSSVQLPDEFLETLWYLHLYSLACCSGDGARLYEQACGLDGLWAIKSPTQWGSTWYWDVNIQQSFWPVYTSNHLELSEVFCRGLLSYVPGNRFWTKTYYGLEGLCPDFPIPFYNCLWPWCSQYLWWHYVYSGDTDFLRNTAYPLFRELLLFFRQYLTRNLQTGFVEMYPDVSPEQGPLTVNATITMSCLRFLLTAALEANGILDEAAEDRNAWQEMLDHLPPLPTGTSQQFGETIRDSEWAEPTQYLAHSSVLMPIYPTGQINKRSSDSEKQLALNTLRYAQTSQALGTHNFGWLACTAARLGQGDRALGIIYDLGVAFLLRINGMFSEKTDRWMQSCLTACGPVYNPPLIESGSALVAAVNEMLLQSTGGLIEIFPALPTGQGTDRGRFNAFGSLEHHKNNYPTGWDDCRFENLLAQGAFEISATRRAGNTVSVKIKSLAGNPLQLVNPFGRDQALKIDDGQHTVSYQIRGDIITFATHPGRTYTLCGTEKQGQPPSLTQPVAQFHEEQPQTSGKTSGVLSRRVITQRRVFLGKDRNTDLYRRLDDSLYDYYAGDQQVSRIAAYKFDFTADRIVKDYRDVLPVQWHGCGKQGLSFISVTTDTLFSPRHGYGFGHTADLHYHDRKLPDLLLRDGIGSHQDNQFLVELPRGDYRLLVIAGDETESVHTQLTLAGGPGCDLGPTAPGQFLGETLVYTQKTDGYLEISLVTPGDQNWNLVALIINHIV